MKHIKYILALFFIFVFNSCMNEYEEAIVGEYVVFEYNNENRINKSSIKSFRLYLFKNKEIRFVVKNKIITGVWKAGDDGDRTFIEFDINGINYQGVIVGENYEIIEILNPNHFISDNITKLSFKRINSPADASMNDTDR
jgi:hypothetical protein